MLSTRNNNKMHNKSEMPFMLKNSDKKFMERQKNVFDQLNTLQCNLRSDEEMDVDARQVQRTRRSVTKQFRGKESIFKVPQDPVNFMKTIPDFKKNPHKWKKYSLADVKDEDMSDRSNTKAAISFLNDLKNRNKEDISDSSEEPKKIVFKKVDPPVQDSSADSEQDSKINFRSSKVVMPEYVVGQKIKKEKKNRRLRSMGNSQLKLDHLYQDD